MIKEVSGPVYNFKESRSRLVLRRKVFAKLGKGDESADLTEMSTAPTQLTNRVYVPLEDSLEEAELNDLLYQPVKEGSAPMKRGGNQTLT